MVVVGQQTRAASEGSDEAGDAKSEENDASTASGGIRLCRRRHLAERRRRRTKRIARRGESKRAAAAPPQQRHTPLRPELASNTVHAEPEDDSYMRRLGRRRRLKPRLGQGR